MTYTGKEDFRAYRRLCRVVALAVVVSGSVAPLARAASLQSRLSDGFKNTFEKITNTGSANNSDASRLNQFLNAGPAYWSVTAPYNLPRGVKLATNTDGTLQDTPLNRYLVWKRDQAPEFFDKRHQRMAPAMQLNDQLRTQAQILAVTKYLTQQAAAQTLQQTSKTASMQVLVSDRQVAAQTIDDPTKNTVPPTFACSCSACVNAAAQTVDPAAQVAPAPVPEPASVATTLALFGAAGVWFRRRRV